MINKSFSECHPILLGASRFKSCEKVLNSEKTKNQYVYRLMIFVSGKATLLISGRKAIIEKGDILYLPPAFPYAILNSHGDFEVINLWFDYENNPSDKAYICGKTVFDVDFNPEKVQSVYEFCDAERLNTSQLIKCCDAHIFGDALFRETVNTDSFSKPAALNLLCYLICKVAEPTDERSNASGRVSDYIRSHVCERLTEDSVALAFSYHKNHINRIVRRETGMCYKSFLLSCKADEAEKLCSETDMTLTEIAHFLGFFDLSHFLKTYSKIKGHQFGKA